jgi:signal transduction histidine kinase
VGEMFKYLFAMEAMITGLYLKEMFVSQEDNLFAFIIAMLLYLSFKLLYYIFYEMHLSNYLLMAIAIGVALASVIFIPALSYFLALNMSQLLQLKKDKYRFAFLFLLGSAFSIPIMYRQSFIIISLSSAVLIYCAYTLEEKAEKMKCKNEALKKSIQRLQEDIATAKQYDAHARYQNQLEQRTQLTQKLHDELGHTLSGNTIQLEAVKLLIERDAEKSRQLLQEVIINLRKGMEAIRTILANEKPDNASVNIGNIKLLASETQEKSKIKINVVYSNEVAAISPQKWVVITGNIREALTNLMKYSKATECKIIFEKLNKLYKVTVKDNGQGCVNIKKGLGVEGMEERMAASDGQLILDGHDGFTIVMLFPISGGNEGR